VAVLVVLALDLDVAPPGRAISGRGAPGHTPPVRESEEWGTPAMRTTGAWHALLATPRR
jgi:hypothetical protein